MIAVYADVVTSPGQCTRVLLNATERRVWLVHRERLPSGLLVLRRDLAGGAVELLSESSAARPGPVGLAACEALSSLPALPVRGPGPRNVGYWPTNAQESGK